MKKQKICIIGGSLTGLVTAISLSRLNCKIDLVTGNINQDAKSNRTVAISQNNYEFLKKLNIFNSINKKNFWSCSKMKLYTEIHNHKFSEIFELNNNDKKEKNILYTLENSKLVKNMLKKIKKIKCISVITNEKISEITNSGLLKSLNFGNSSKYNLIIICTGNNSDLAQSLFRDQSITYSYGETSISTIIDHDIIKNETARQIFLDNAIFAALPISSTRTSIVWSVKKNMKKKNNMFVKKKIKYYTENFFKKIKFITNIEYKNLDFLIQKKYYQDRILLFGDALHVAHPFVGQGFNMTLRDLFCLEKILNEKINLGLDIGSSDILSEFTDEVKPRNFAYSMGINFLKNIFSNNNKTFKKFRSEAIKILNKSNFAKNIFFNIADKGFKF